MPTSTPHACANSQPSLAAWPEIWTAASRKECDNAIKELGRRRTYFLAVRNTRPALALSISNYEAERKGGNRSLTKRTAGSLGTNSVPIEESRKRHVTGNRGNENQQRGNWSQRPKGCVQALLSQRRAGQSNRRLAGDCSSRRHPRLSRGKRLHQPRRFLRADVSHHARPRIPAQYSMPGQRRTRQRPTRRLLCPRSTRLNRRHHGTCQDRGH